MFTNICRGLFEKDKMLYAFMIAVGILRQAGEVRVSPSTADGGKARWLTFSRNLQAATVDYWLVRPMKQASYAAWTPARLLSFRPTAAEASVDFGIGL